MNVETTFGQAFRLQNGVNYLAKILDRRKREKVVVAAFFTYFTLCVVGVGGHKWEDRKEQVGNTQRPLTLLSTSTCRDGRTLV